VVKRSGLLLLTWGGSNNSAESIKKQEELGVDGVIYDW